MSISESVLTVRLARASTSLAVVVSSGVVVHMLAVVGTVTASLLRIVVGIGTGVPVVDIPLIICKFFCESGCCCSVLKALRKLGVVDM